MTRPGTALLLVGALLGCARDEAAGREEIRQERRHALRPSASEEPRKARRPPRAGHPPLATSPEGLMKAGAVRDVQEALRQHGYGVELSGSLDRATTEAIRTFQGTQQLAQTGMPDQRTLERLGMNPDRVYRRNP